MGNSSSSSRATSGRSSRPYRPPSSSSRGRDVVALNANESISKEKAELRSPFVAQRLESESRLAPPSYNESQQRRPHTTSWRAPNVEYLRTPLRQESFDDALQTLVQYDTVIIVDDSGSMRGHLWKEVCFLPLLEVLNSSDNNRPQTLSRSWQLLPPSTT